MSQGGGRSDKDAGLPNELDKRHSDVASPRTLPVVSEKLPCSVAERCGGCPEFALTLDQQREAKVRALLAGLTKHKVEYEAEVRWLVGRSLGYRNRIRLALKSGEPTYFNLDKDPACAVLDPQLLTALATFRRWASTCATELTAYCVAEVRMPDADQISAVYLRHTQRNGQVSPTPDWRRLPSEIDGMRIAVEGGPVRFQRFMIDEGVHARIPISGFMQVNATANRLMVRKVIQWAAQRRVRRALDLFAGSGNFALPLAADGRQVVAVEFDAAACQALTTAAGEQDVSPISVIAGDALVEAERLAATSGETFDMVVLDPPRGGLRGDVAAVVRLANDSIVLVSCDAKRFCDDARALCDHGFRLLDCVAVDMFPHTSHLEVVGHFVRR